MNNDWNPNHGGKQQFKKKNRYQLKDDPIIFRILPQPKGSEYNSLVYNNTPFSNEWHKFHSIVFGYKNMEGKHRVFESPFVKNNKTKMVESPCAATERVTTLKAKLEEARATSNAAVQPKLNALVGLKGVYSIDNNQHLNVMLLDGSIGELKLRYKAFLVLKAEIDKLRKGSVDEPGFDPLSFTNGRFFVMTRSTAGRDTTFSAAVYKEKVEVPGHGKMEKALVHVITPEILARLEKEGVDLNNVSQKVTAEECAQIVSESDLMSGKSPACNRIFDDRWKANRPNNVDDNGPDAPDPVSPAVAPTVATPTLVSSIPPTATPVTATVNQPITSPTVNLTTPPVQAKTQAQAVDEMSDADFFAAIGVPQAQA